MLKNTDDANYIDNLLYTVFGREPKSMSMEKFWGNETEKSKSELL